MSKAGHGSLVANAALSVYAYPDKQCVPVAIGADRFHASQVAGSFALGPKLIAAATEECGKSTLQGFLQRLTVHEANHEYCSALGILEHDREQSMHFVEFEIKHDFVSYCAKQKARCAHCVSGLNLELLLFSRYRPPLTRGQRGDDDADALVKAKS